MKKLSFFLMAMFLTLCVTNAFGETYFEDTFSDVGTGENTEVKTRTGWSSFSKCYAQYNSGVRVGSSSAAGNLTKTAMTNISGTKDLKVTIYTAKYNTNGNSFTITATNGTITSVTGVGKLNSGTLTVTPNNNAGVTSTTSKATWTDAYKTEFIVSGATSSTTIKFATNKRAILGPVTIEDASASGEGEEVEKVDLGDLLKWSAASATVTVGADDNEFPTLTNTNGVDVTYTSSTPATATIDATGNITLVAAGTTTISAFYEGGDDAGEGKVYAAKTVSYTLTVKPAPLVLEPIEGGIIDILTHSNLTASSTSYTEFTGKQAANDGHSAAVYAGRTARNGNTTQHNIQLNSIDKGRIATTTTGGLAKRVYVRWASQTANTNDRALYIYGSNEAFTGSETTDPSTKIGTVTFTTGAEEAYADLTGDYPHILITGSGAIYMDEIQVTWTPAPIIYHTVSVTAENGTVEGLAEEGKYEHGATATLTATAAEGYEFTCWTIGEDTVSTENPYTFAVTADAALVANFKHITLHKVLVGENLQAVVDQALSGDTVLVQAGTYEDNFTMKDGVYVSGGWNADFTAQTKHASILDAKANGRVLNQPANFETLTIWENFTIQNGKLTEVLSDKLGAGVALLKNGRVINCLVQNNTFTYDPATQCAGGGIAQNYNGDTCAINCIVRNNRATHGGGIRTAGVAINCLVENNEATGNGGGVYLHNIGQLHNSIVRNNVCKKDVGGIDIAAVGGAVYNCLVVGNHADGNIGGVQARKYNNVVNTTIVGNNHNTTTADRVTWAGFRASDNTATNYNGKLFVNNVIWGNTHNDTLVNQVMPYLKHYATNGKFVNNALQGSSDALDTISTVTYIHLSAENDPQFNEDYSFATTSPLYNAGTNDALAYFVGDKDVYGNARKQGANIEIGAVEIAEQPAPTTYDITTTAEVSAQGQNIILSATWEEKSLNIMLWQGGATQGFGSYAIEDYAPLFWGTTELTPTTQGVYVDNGDGTFTFTCSATDGSITYNITLTGENPKAVDSNITIESAAEFTVYEGEGYSELYITAGDWVNYEWFLDLSIENYNGDGTYEARATYSTMNDYIVSGTVVISDGGTKATGTLATADESIVLNITLTKETAGPGSEFEVMEDFITNMVLDLGTMTCTGGPSNMFGMNVELYIGEPINETDFAVTENSVVTRNGDTLTLISGYLTNIDMTVPSLTAVLVVQFNEYETYEFHFAMTSAEIEPIVIEIENANVKVDEYVPFEGATPEYSLVMTANWTDENSVTYPVKVDVLVYDPNATEPTESMCNVVIGDIVHDPYLGGYDGCFLEITTVNGVVTAKGLVTNPNTNFAADITISGKLPTGEATNVENNMIDAKAVKVIRNGQLIIRQGDVEYNAQGAIVK